MREGGIYQILLRESARRALEEVEGELQARLIAAIQRLKTDPFPNGATTIKGAPGFRRIRVSNYRIVYCARDHTIEVAVIAHRREVYKRLYRLLW